MMKVWARCYTIMPELWQVTQQTRNIGIGISKRKCVVCVMDDKGRIQEETAYDNNPLSSSIMLRVSNIT